MRRESSGDNVSLVPSENFHPSLAPLLPIGGRSLGLQTATRPLGRQREGAWPQALARVTIQPHGGQALSLIPVQTTGGALLCCPVGQAFPESGACLPSLSSPFLFYFLYIHYIFFGGEGRAGSGAQREKVVLTPLVFLQTAGGADFSPRDLLGIFRLSMQP